MDAEVKAGRIRGPFGGSNWTMERMDEAIAYAEQTGKQKPGALSNNFSLAEMLEPIWAGCVTASDRRLEGLAEAPGRCRTSPGRARAAASSPTAPAATSATMRRWCASGIRSKNFGRRDRAIELADRAGQEPDPCRARLCAGAALPVGPADRPAHAGRTGGQPEGARYQAVAGGCGVAG